MLKILVVEDNEAVRAMLVRRLGRLGHTVLAAVHGEEGVALARAERPNVILMDMSMPVMDGWTATRTLRADPDTRGIPIIAITAHAMEGDHEGAIGAGCDDVETKPIDLPRLLEKMQALCRPQDSA